MSNLCEKSFFEHDENTLLAFFNVITGFLEAASGVFMLWVIWGLMFNNNIYGIILVFCYFMYKFFYGMFFMLPFRCIGFAIFISIQNINGTDIETNNNFIIGSPKYYEKELSFLESIKQKG